MSAISKNIPVSNTRTAAWAMWLIAAIFFGYQYILRVMPSIMMNDIMQQFNIDLATFGQFSGIYYIGYSLMHLPLGILLDRFGPKYVMPACILMTVVGVLPILFATYWLYPIIGRLLIGMGSSAAILSLFKIVRMNFAEEKFTRMLSFAISIGLVGAIYGGSPVNYMCETLGYKTVTIIFAALGVALGIVAYMLIPHVKTEKSASIYADIKEVFKSKKVMAICLLAGLMVGPLEGFADVWGKEFLQRVYGLEGTIAAGLTSAIFIGMCFGAPLLSYIAAKTKQDLLTIVIAGMIMALSFVFLLTGSLNTAIMSVMFNVVGVCCTYQTLSIFKASTSVRENLVGLATAVANMIIMIFGYAFHSVIGLVINIYGNNNPSAFSYGIAVIPIALTIGAVGYLILYWQENRQAITEKMHTEITV